MKIAIIDSGIDIKHKRLKGVKAYGISIRKNGNLFFLNSDFEDEIGHGTGITSIIYKLCPYAELFVIKVFHKSKTTSESVLTQAIIEAIKHNVHIINLSLGLFWQRPTEDLYNVCKLAYEKKIPIISAGDSNLTHLCYPASFNEVFGIIGGKVQNITSYGHLRNYKTSFDFIAKGNAHRVASIDGGFVMADGASYATAYFTGIVASALKSNHFKNIESLRQHLSINADESIKPEKTKKKSDIQLIIQSGNQTTIIKKYIDFNLKYGQIGRLGIFPCSEKEMSIFTRNNFKTSAPITKFFDYPRSLDIYGHEKPVQSWFTNQDINEFDTLVVGYFFEHDFQGNVKFGFDLITEMIKADKNLFLFDTELKEIIQKKYLTNKYKGKIYCPEINKETYKDFSTFHFSNKPTTPTLSVIGTSSKQGKFTTQLIIKELLQNKGYKVSHISTEPHGELLGADFSFPMGYNPTVVIPQQQWPDLLRNVTKAIEHYHNPDLILSGIQSWTIPIGYPEITGNEFRSLYFLLGVQPDACICAINPNDSIDHINRSVTAAKLVSKSEILFYTIIPYEITINKVKGITRYSSHKLSKEAFTERINYYSKELQKPVFDIMNTSNKELILSLIQSYYS